MRTIEIILMFGFGVSGIGLMGLALLAGGETSTATAASGMAKLKVVGGSDHETEQPESDRKVKPDRKAA